MTSTQTLSLLAALTGLGGGTILAFSLNRVLSEVRLALDMVATSVESIASNGDIYVFTGLDTRLKNAARISNSWVRAGLYCLLASAGLTALSLFSA
jgi:hypothetical protein